MKQGSDNSYTDVLAMFTVCADSELSNIAVSAPVYVPGIEFAGDFSEYISKDRRPQFPSSIKQASSCVAFVDFDRDWEQAIETVEMFDTIREPHIVSVGISSELNTDKLLRAMRAGCGEFLRKPVDQSSFQSSLERWQARLLAGKGGRRGEIISIFGVKGGVGATSLSVYLGLQLADQCKKKVLLIDHHYQLGHIALFLGIKDPQYHFDELIRNAEKLDTNLLNGFVVNHNSGLHVLASPDRLKADQPASRSQIEQIFDFLRREYDFVIVDSSFNYSETTMPIAHLSDHINLVTTPDLAALRDLIRHMDHLRSGESISAKLRIILNRASQSDDVNADQISHAVHHDVFLTVPNYHPNITRAMNTGVPLSSKKRSPFESQIAAWAKRIAPQEVEHTRPGKKSLWRFGK
jgi:pilus assembly protein CpaE